MLYLIATPIGNIEDITIRALNALKQVDFVLAEDTRKASMLLKRFGIDKPLASFYEHNEPKKSPWVIDQLKKGINIALISSAGTPTISDPGFKLVRECREKSLKVVSLPGASSIINAVALSGLRRENFAFLGFMPRKPNARKKLLERFKNADFALVFFESPHRLLGTLKDIGEAMGTRKITIAREMTKKFEEVLELNVQDALEHFKQQKPKGEFTIVVDR
ncbi:MAG: 16S rRNA (cytidine(1402)-2'-O)-methyltransferase [Candidatus Omnitrophota bacterium]